MVNRARAIQRENRAGWKPILLYVRYCGDWCQQSCSNVFLQQFGRAWWNSYSFAGRCENTDAGHKCTAKYRSITTLNSNVEFAGPVPERGCFANHRNPTIDVRKFVRCRFENTFYRLGTPDYTWTGGLRGTYARRWRVCREGWNSAHHEQTATLRCYRAAGGDGVDLNNEN